MVDRSIIGQSLGVRSTLVEKGRLRFFSKVIGETNPIYSDEAAAKLAGHRHIPVPPTYLFCLQHEAFDSQGGAASVKANPGRTLHGEQKFVYHEMAYVGDTLTFDVKVADVYDKKGGALEFIVKESRVTNQDGRHIADLVSTGVQKNT